jgi:hypothetical protein
MRLQRLNRTKRSPGVSGVSSEKAAAVDILVSVERHLSRDLRAHLRYYGPDDVWQHLPRAIQRATSTKVIASGRCAS